MNKTKNPLILGLAIIGACTVVYLLWHLYQQRSAENEVRSRFAPPVSSGVPDLLHASPAASPLPP
jgi:hypothetical protein